MSDETVLRKVRKLLALSSDKPNDEESQTAILLAQSLMAKHNIEMSQVEGEILDAKKEVVHEWVTERSSRIPFWKKSIGTVIADNFRCMCYTSRGNGQGRLIFLGLKEDTEIAKEMFEFAINTLQYNVDRYMRQKSREGVNTTGLRNDYIIGFIRGLSDKLKEQVEKNNWGLVLVKDALVVQEIDRMKFTSGSSSRVQRGHSSDAYNQGYSTGNSLSKHKQLGGR